MAAPTVYAAPPLFVLNSQDANVSVIDPVTVRYTFASPMPDFLPKLAGPLPLILFVSVFALAVGRLAGPQREVMTTFFAALASAMLW